MAKEALVSTGVEWLDQLLGELRIGENVVWEVEAGTSVDAFVCAFLEANIKAKSRFVYVSFNHSPVTMKEKLGDLFDKPNFILVDCFTDGKGHGDSVFSRFYEIAPEADRAHVIRVSKPDDVEAFSAAINQIESEAGIGAKYIFDSLTGMQDLWGDPARAYRFFTYACPRLYDLRTIAYWVLEKEAHTASFSANLKHVTQVAIALARSEGGRTLQLLKAEGRELSAEVESPQHYRIEGDRLRLVAEGRQELFRLGRLIRAARLSRGLSQAELGEILGVTASTVSQAENGVIALSLTNLFALARELKLDLGEILQTGEPPQDAVGIVRAADRTRKQIGGSKAKPVSIEALLSTAGAAGPEASLVVLPAGATLKKHFSLRKGAEFGFLLSGEVEVEVAGKTRRLAAGDVIFLAKDTPSRWASVGREEARLLWVADLG